MQRLVRLLLVLGAAAAVVGLIAALRRRTAEPATPTYTFDETDEAGA